MSETTKVEIVFRIPGTWDHPTELVKALPPGHHLTEDGLILRDGTPVRFSGCAPDDEFAKVFKQSCRRPPTKAEMQKVKDYKVNIFLSGPGGSMRAARKMMEAGAAVVKAGGAGVFIDNGAIAHGGETWLDLAEDGSPDAVSFAFTCIVGDKKEVRTMGMHAFGLRDIVMDVKDCEETGMDIVAVIRYMAAAEKTVDDAHILANEEGPLYSLKAIESEKLPKDSPMFNPFGRFRLVNVRGG